MVQDYRFFSEIKDTLKEECSNDHLMVTNQVTDMLDD